MKLINCIDNAALWLVLYVKSKNIDNFKIIKSNVRENGSYVFSVTYTWKLNAWDKVVNKDICVVYNADTKTFETADI